MLYKPFLTLVDPGKKFVTGIYTSVTSVNTKQTVSMEVNLTPPGYFRDTVSLKKRVCQLIIMKQNVSVTEGLRRVTPLLLNI